MTTLADLPTVPMPSGGYRVDGPCALVPGTVLRLPVIPLVWHLPPAERCGGCAGTTVVFFDDALTVCPCTSTQHLPVEAFDDPAAAAAARTGEAGGSIGFVKSIKLRPGHPLPGDIAFLT
jgi:hypothetical protein